MRATREAQYGLYACRSEGQLDTSASGLPPRALAPTLVGLGSRRVLTDNAGDLFPLIRSVRLNAATASSRQPRCRCLSAMLRNLASTQMGTNFGHPS